MRLWLAVWNFHVAMLTYPDWLVFIVINIFKPMMVITGANIALPIARFLLLMLSLPSFKSDSWVTT